ncbi:MAG: antitermination protein NusG [Bacteroidota bacterium]|nr:antitermination protein NusG [Bacteroidota bacterium]
MQKNWYIIYTKQKCEKKVAGLLTKKKIENFCPLNCKTLKQFRKSKVIYEPLFPSFVFVCLRENEIFALRHMEHVVNIVYWRGNPAIINDDEINAIKHFSEDHQNVKLEKSDINVEAEAQMIHSPSYSMEGKILMVKNKTFKINLPSLGYTMIAEIERADVIGREISFGNRELSLQ